MHPTVFPNAMEGLSLLPLPNIDLMFFNINRIKHQGFSVQIAIPQCLTNTRENCQNHGRAGHHSSSFNNFQAQSMLLTVAVNPNLCNKIDCKTTLTVRVFNTNLSITFACPQDCIDTSPIFQRTY